MKNLAVSSLAALTLVLGFGSVALGGVHTTPSMSTLSLGIDAPSQDAAATGRTPARKDVHTASIRSNLLTLTVNGRSVQLTPGDLEQMPQTEVTVINGHNQQSEKYRGVSVSHLLATVGVPSDPVHQQQILRSYLRAEGTDFYFVLYSGAEVQPAMHDGTVLVALQKDGNPLGEDGRFKLISTGDKRPARWVRNLTSITMVTVN